MRRIGVLMSLDENEPVQRRCFASPTGTDLVAILRGAATYVDRILRGAKPALANRDGPVFVGVVARRDAEG
jgi:hypothetical protein